MRLRIAIFIGMFSLPLHAQQHLPLDSLLNLATRTGLIQPADYADIQKHYSAPTQWNVPGVEAAAELCLLDWLARKTPAPPVSAAQLRQARLISAATEKHCTDRMKQQGNTSFLHTAKSLTIWELRRYGARTQQCLEALKKQSFVSEKHLESLDQKVKQVQPYTTADILSAFNLKFSRCTVWDTAKVEVAERARRMFEALLPLIPDLKVIQWTITPETRDAQRFELRFKANGLEYSQTLNWHFNNVYAPGTSVQHSLYPQLPLGLLNKALLDMGSDERLFLAASALGDFVTDPELWVTAVSRRQFKNIQEFFSEHQTDTWAMLVQFTPSRFMENSGERASMFARWQRYGLLSKNEMIRATNAWPLIEDDLSKDIEQRPASREYLYLLYIKSTDEAGPGIPLTQEQFKAGVNQYLGKLSNARLMNDTLAGKIRSRMGNVLDDGTILIPADAWVLIQAIKWGRYTSDQPQLDSLLQEGRQRRIFAPDCKLHLPLEEAALRLCWHSGLPHFSASMPVEAPTLSFLKTQLDNLAAWFNQYFPDEKIEAIEVSQQSGGQNALSSVVVSCRLNGNPAFYEYAGLPEYVQMAPFLSGFLTNLIPFYKHSYYFNDPKQAEDSPCLLYTGVRQDASDTGGAYPTLHFLRVSRRDAKWLAAAWKEWLFVE